MSYLLDANVFMSANNLQYGLAGPHVLVTHEVPGTSPNRIKIPNVCVGLGVRFMAPYQMLRTEQARFVLGTLA